MLKIIEFDSTNPNWTNVRDHNYMLIKCHEHYVNDVIKHQGYIYLNQICELLGAGWNPHDENLCIINNYKNKDVYIRFEIIDRLDESITILIHRYDY